MPPIADTGTQQGADSSKFELVTVWCHITNCLVENHFHKDAHTNIKKHDGDITHGCDSDRSGDFAVAGFYGNIRGNNSRATAG